MIRVTRLGQHGGHAAQQLGQDGPGVPPGTDQRTVRHGPHDVGVSGHGGAGLMGGEDRFDGGGGGLHGEVEVGAGVPVGDRIDVDGVDGRPLPAEGLQGQ